MKSVATYLTKVRYLKDALTFIGNHTMIIACCHFLMFKVASLLIVLYRKDEFYKIAMYPVIFDVSEIVKIFYVAISIAGCLGIYGLYNFFMRRLWRRKENE